MRTATIQVRKDTASALSELGERFVRAWQSGESDGDVIQFESPRALFRVLTPRRWELIERLQAIGPSSLRGLARAVGRDVKRVHEDVAVLLEWGLVARTQTDQLQVPYAVIHADFNLTAAA